MNTPTFTQASINISDMAQTWNAGATTFTAIKMNVTDTASAAGSSLLDLQVGGVSRFAVSKTGLVTIGGGGVTVPQLTFTPNSGIACSLGMANGGSQLGFYAGGNSSISFSGSNLNLASNVLLSWTNGINNPFTTTDLFLARDAANALAQRNGVNAQSFRVYNTFTDASNFERGQITWSGNSLIISSENSGTGIARGLIVRAASNLSLSGSSGAGEQWAILNTGTLRPNPNNTHDIGTSSVRVKDIWLAGSLNSGGSIATESGNLRITNDAGVMSWGASNDVNLLRDGAANTLAQRNSTNPQVFRVYNTFTDGSNFERGAVAWVSNALTIGTFMAGSGIARPLQITIGGSNVVQWSAAGHMLWNSDNTFDIGASGLSRPRTIWAGTAIVAGSSVSIIGKSAITSASDGVLMVSNNATTGFNRLQFGGTTSSFPSISRNAANIDFRLADDSALTGIGAASVSVAASTTARPHFALTAGVAPTSPANGDIWFDGTNLNIRIGGVTRTVNVT